MGMEPSARKSSLRTRPNGTNKTCQLLEVASLEQTKLRMVPLPIGIDFGYPVNCCNYSAPYVIPMSSHGKCVVGAAHGCDQRR